MPLFLDGYHSGGLVEGPGNLPDARGPCLKKSSPGGLSMSQEASEIQYYGNRKACSIREVIEMRWGSSARLEKEDPEKTRQTRH